MLYLCTPNLDVLTYSQQCIVLNRFNKHAKFDVELFVKQNYFFFQCDKAFTVSATLKAHIERVHINVIV